LGVWGFGVELGRRRDLLECIGTGGVVFLYKEKLPLLGSSRPVGQRIRSNNRPIDTACTHIHPPFAVGMKVSRPKMQVRQTPRCLKPVLMLEAQCRLGQDQDVSSPSDLHPTPTQTKILKPSTLNPKPTCPRCSLTSSVSRVRMRSSVARHAVHTWLAQACCARHAVHTWLAQARFVLLDKLVSSFSSLLMCRVLHVLHPQPSTLNPC
jgi:hypothetical protein